MSREEPSEEHGCCAACAASEGMACADVDPRADSPATGTPRAKASGTPRAKARDPGLDRGQRRELGTIAGALALAVAGFVVWSLRERGAPYAVAGAVLLGSAYLLAGFDVLRGAARNILAGRVMDEMFLMAVASVGAFAIGAMEEAVGVMLFYRLGEFMQELAAGRSRRSIRALLELRPDTARILRDGAWTVEPAGNAAAGDLTLVRPGERVPTDGDVVEGSGSFDTSAMTGESVPRPAGPGDEALSGFIVRDAALTIRVSRPASESSAARIVDLVENASKHKARTELFISRFAKRYTPAVVIAAAMVAVVPPLFVPGQAFADWAYRALVMLVISCPCAFVISVPLGYFGGLGGAARRGILVKGASVLDALADAGTVVFDKTGTLTDGSFRIREMSPADGFDERGLLRGAAAAGTHSNHPLARAVRAAWASTGESHPDCEAGSYREIPGHGTVAVHEGSEVLAGGHELLHLMGIPHQCAEARGTEIHVAVAGRYAGRIEVGDALKPDGRDALRRLGALGIRRIAMLTGDAKAPSERTASEAGIAEVHHGLLPEGKLRALEAIMDQERAGGRSVLFVGDGVNDAPVLARADAGIAMGGAGSDAAVDSADVVLMTDEPSRVAEAIERARRTRRIVVQNIVFALGIKVAFLGLGALGLAAMWEAVIADVGVALLAVLNSTRALR